MQNKGRGFFLVLSLISAGLLINCRSQPASAPAAQRTASPPPKPAVEPEQQDSPEEIPPLRFLSKKILDRAYNRDHLDAKKFQYFISETMEMERGQSVSTLVCNEKGELFQEDNLIQEKIIIERETMGVAVDIRVGEDYERWEIDVRFDPVNDRTLTFVENDEGSSFDLFYVETRAGKKIPYGNEEYDLSFTEIPRLSIKLAETSTNVPAITTVGGITVDSLP
jgi:hypothetical protein